jgi:hypothetical protein
MNAPVFYISCRPDLSPKRPYGAVQCGAGMLHRYLSGLVGFETLESAVKWSREFEKSSGYTLLSREDLPEWFTRWAGVPQDAVSLAFARK